MLVVVLGDVRHVEVGVAFVGELLELGVEGFLTAISIVLSQDGQQWNDLPERS
jgi:hypothetical protein